MFRIFDLLSHRLRPALPGALVVIGLLLH